MDFKVMTFLKSNIVKMTRLKDKVTITQLKTRWNYTYHGMVLCLV